MKNTVRMVILALLSVLCLIVAMGVGSVFVQPQTTARVLFDALFRRAPSQGIDPTIRSILLSIRVPRTLLAFVSGAGLSVSGVMMQSVLKNPLASSFTLGVSSGAAVGASIAIMLSLSMFGVLTLPIFGLTAGLLTVFAALAVASRVDRNLGTSSILLTGMAFSLFANALIPIVMTYSRDQLQRIVYWQMGSFSMKSPEHVVILTPIVLIGVIVCLAFSRQMDILTLGDEQAQTSGVHTSRMKWMLLSLGAVITGSIVSIVGVIGFVDLFTPHVARKLVGAQHRLVVPAAALLGGAFMVFCDLVSRTIASPLELPVGAVTSAIGAPFFLWLYFRGRRQGT